MRDAFSFETAEGWMIEIDLAEPPRPLVRHAEIAGMFYALGGGSTWERIEAALLADSLRRKQRARRQYLTGKVDAAIGRCRACGELGHNARGCPLDGAAELARASSEAAHAERRRKRLGHDVGTCGACGGLGHNIRACNIENVAEAALARRRARKAAWERARRTRAAEGLP